MNETLWLDPAAIRFKIAPVTGLAGLVAGDWDIERRHVFAATVKHRSMVQRLIEGRAWIETDLFTDAYARRLQAEGQIGGCRSLAELADQYERRFDKLAQDFRAEGFRLVGRNGKRHPLPAFLVGRDGEVMIGNQGNHRLAMAQVLGLERIAGRIVCRHS